MDEELHLGREIVMDNVLEKWYVDTSSSKVGNNQKLGLLLSERDQSILTCPLIHRTEDVNALQARLGK